jgi:hypothetical protein
MDVDSIKPGEHRTEAISRAVAKCGLMLVLIDNQWGQVRRAGMLVLVISRTRYGLRSRPRSIGHPDHSGAPGRRHDASSRRPARVRDDLLTAGRAPRQPQSRHRRGFQGYGRSGIDLSGRLMFCTNGIRSPAAALGARGPAFRHLALRRGAWGPRGITAQTRLSVS